MADDFKRARIQRSQLRTCDCCDNPASNKQARIALKRSDAEMIDRVLARSAGVNALLKERGD